MSERDRTNTAIWVAVIAGVLALCGTIITVMGPPLLNRLFRDTPTPAASVSIPPQPTDVPTLEPTNPPVPGDVPTTIPTDTSVPPTPTFTPPPTPFGGGGQKIAFKEEHEIWTVNIDGSEKTQLTFEPGRCGGPDWSPDGRKIAFLCSRGASNEIYVMNGDGSEQTPITFDDFTEIDLAWSPDGQHIAYSASPGGFDDMTEIYVMRADGSDQIRLTSNDAYDGQPSWSPDGTQIVFASNRDGQPTEFGLRKFGIYKMNADGSQQTRLTFEPNVNFSSPSWSPDASHIIFATDRDGNGEIYVMNPDGSGQFNVTESSTTEDEVPAWSPDGTMIVYRSSGDIFIIRVDGKLVKKLPDGTDPSWQP